jgi:hypothetical protein
LYSADGGSYVIGNGDALPYVPGGQLNTANGTITATLANLTPGTKYDFSLWTPITETSDDELQQYAFGNTSATTAGTASLTAPNSPGNAVASWSVPSETGVFVHWIDNSNNETGFWVYRSEGGTAFNASSAVAIASLGADTTTYDDTDANPDQNSYYYVFAYDGPSATAPAVSPTSQPTMNPTSQPAEAPALALVMHVSTSPPNGVFQGPFFARLEHYLIYDGLDRGVDINSYCQNLIQQIGVLDPTIFQDIVRLLKSQLDNETLSPHLRVALKQALNNAGYTTSLSTAISKGGTSAVTLVATSLIYTSDTDHDWYENFSENGQGSNDWLETTINPDDSAGAFKIEAGSKQGSTFQFTALVPTAWVRTAPPLVAKVSVNLFYDGLDKNLKYGEIKRSVWLYAWVTT